MTRVGGRSCRDGRGAPAVVAAAGSLCALGGSGRAAWSQRRSGARGSTASGAWPSSLRLGAVARCGATRCGCTRAPRREPSRAFFGCRIVLVHVLAGQRDPIPPLSAPVGNERLGAEKKMRRDPAPPHPPRTLVLASCVNVVSGCPGRNCLLCHCPGPRLVGDFLRGLCRRCDRRARI